MQQVFSGTASALAPVVTEKELAAARQAARNEKARASIAHNTIAQYMQGVTDAGTVVPEGYTVTVLADNGRGRNARGLCGHKRGFGGSQPKGAKRAKKQNTAIKGAQPRLARTNWDHV